MAVLQRNNLRILSADINNDIAAAAEKPCCSLGMTGDLRNAFVRLKAVVAFADGLFLSGYFCAF